MKRSLGPGSASFERQPRGGVEFNYNMVVGMTSLDGIMNWQEEVWQRQSTS